MLSGWPTKLTSTQQMIVDVKNTLTGTSAAVYHDAKPIVCDAVVPRQLGSYAEDFTGERIITGFEIEKCRDMFTRDNENMNRRSWPDVLESHDRVVLINNLSFGLAIDDVAKKAVPHGFSLFPAV